MDFDNYSLPKIGFRGFRLLAGRQEILLCCSVHGLLLGNLMTVDSGGRIRWWQPL